MKRGVLKAIFCAFLLNGCAADDVSYVRASASPIVGGEPASSEDFYGTVALVDPSSVFCTGTLIAPRVVATAAHCLFSPSGDAVTASDFSVVVGASDPVSEGTEHAVSLALPHEQYNPNALPGGLDNEYDLALLVLEQSVAGQATVPIVSTSMFDDNVQTGDPIIISGYGFRDESAQDLSQFGELFIAETPYNTRTEYEYSTGGPNETDSCSGDSGGPGYVAIQGTTYLVGATSRSLVAGDPPCGMGAINTFLPNWVGWFEEQSDGAFSSQILEEDESSGSPTTTEEDSGCSVATHGAHRHPSWLVFMLLSAPVVLARRRWRRVGA